MHGPCLLDVMPRLAPASNKEVCILTWWAGPRARTKGAQPGSLHRHFCQRSPSGPVFFGSWSSFVKTAQHVIWGFAGFPLPGRQPGGSRLALPRPILVLSLKRHRESLTPLLLV